MEVLLDESRPNSANVVNLPDINGNTPLHLAAQAGIGYLNDSSLLSDFANAGNFLTVASLLKHPR